MKGFKMRYKNLAPDEVVIKIENKIDNCLAVGHTHPEDNDNLVKNTKVMFGYKSNNLRDNKYAVVPWKSVIVQMN